ncbi:MAG: hypothetical protein LBP78_04415 [Acidaminococcales bacterium]|jgi:hypothetical protein|nr:hypothetical protein [Acidaminococcales bacterium]
MYLHIGSGVVVDTKKVIGVFNLKGLKENLFCTEEFKREGDFSCVLTDEGVFFSELSSLTLQKRAENALREIDKFCGKIVVRA